MVLLGSSILTSDFTCKSYGMRKNEKKEKDLITLVCYNTQFKSSHTIYNTYKSAEVGRHRYA